METELNTHTHMDEARLSYSIFYLSTATEKMFKNSTIAFSFCVFLFPSTLTHFHSLEILQIAHTLARAGGVGKVLPKSFCSWRGRVRWHLFTSFCWEVKTFSNLWNCWKRERIRLSIIQCCWFQNFFVCLFMHSISGNTCWTLLGRGSGTADKNGLLSVQTPQLSLVFLNIHVLW